jgi:hypothetical protein
VEIRMKLRKRRVTSFVLAVAVLATTATALAFAFSAGPFSADPTGPDPRSLRPVTIVEARQALAEVVRMAGRSDDGELCRFATPGCRGVGDSRYSLEPEFAKTIPDVPPEVTGARECVADQKYEPLVVLELEGVDRDGRPYKTDFAVTREPGGSLFYPFRVYWQPIFGFDTQPRQCYRAF